MTAPTRQGPRVRLVFPQESDGPELIALNRASRDFYRGLTSPPVTPDGFARYLERCGSLEANIQPENRPSLALVARLGFTREGLSRRYLKIGGRWRDHERWAILAEDWRARARE
ncbi:MAG: GNAT family N-acetyltransferase [Acidobacteria bacterium]|nr:GNAT family N-acetyltransferase [Acidobacteriota bacterium]